jgi:putative transposase
MRRITNTVFYVLCSGCAWRYLPREYGAWQTVYYSFRQWRRDGTWIQIHAHWVVAVRKASVSCYASPHLKQQHG